MKSQTKAYCCAVATVLMWSTVASAFKLALQYLQPLQLVFGASLFSTLALFVILLVQKKLPLLLRLPTQLWLRCFVIGWINPCLYYLVLFEAYNRLSAQEAVAINYSWPVMLVLLSVVFLKQKLRWLELAAIIIAYLGVVLVAMRGEIASLEFSNPLGVILALVSTFVWAIYWIMNVRLIRQQHDAIVILYLCFLSATPVLGLVVYFVQPIQHFYWQSLLGAIYIGCFEMGFAFVLWIMALHLSSTTAKVSRLAFAAPFLSLLVVHFVLGEDIQAATFVGLTLIVAGVVLQSLFAGKNLQVER